MYREGRPELLYGWKQEGAQLILRLQQVQTSAGYRLPFELAAIAQDDTSRFVFEHTGGFQEFRFAVNKPLAQVVVDPDYWVLKTLQQTDFNRLGVDATPTPETFALQPIYPNPFVFGKNQLTVNFSLGRSENVRLAVFNALGQEVAVLLANRLPSGDHVQIWDGRSARGDLTPAGLYFVRLQTETAQATRKFVILR